MNLQKLMPYMMEDSNLNIFSFSTHTEQDIATFQH